MKKKVILKDILDVTITESKKSVKTLTERQLKDLVSKIEKIKDIVFTESNTRFENKLQGELDQEFDNVELEDSDEV